MLSSNKKKIVQIIDTAYLGGAEKATYLLSREFVKKDFTVFLFFPPGPYASTFKTLEAEGIKTFELPIRTNFFKSVFLLRKVLILHEIKYIHSHQIKADLLSVLATLFLKKNIIKVTTVHCIIKFDIKNILKRFLYYIPSFVTYHLVNKVFTVSSGVNKIIREYYHLNPRKVVTTLNSISFDEVITNKTNRKKIITEFGFKQDDFLIICAGILSYRKGQEILIRAFVHLKDLKYLKLVLLGDGDLRTYLEELVERIDLTDQIVFAGHRADIYDWMAISSIYIQPSIYDPLPRAMLEAMYLGLPVIASDIETIKDVIKDGETGIVTSIKPESIAATIRRLIDDKRLREKISKNAKAFILQNCSMDRMIHTIIKNLNQ